MAIQEIANSILGTIAEKCIDPILRQFRYLIFCKSNVKSLSDSIKKLELKETEVQQLVRQAKDNAEEIKATVVDWLKQVEDAKKDAHTISEGMETAEVNCFNIVGLPNLKSCYLLGRRAVKRTSVVEKLLGEGQFDEVGNLPPLGKMPLSELTPSFEEGLVSRMSTKKQVMEALKQEKTSLLVICGMAGVGKTTLVKQIADQVKLEKLFDEVAFATVSQSPDMRNVQDQLAEQLGMEITQQTDLPRAERLYTRLINSDKITLVILDDIWKELDLKSLGIPVKGECKSLKVILTSRLLNVCRGMGAEIFEVNILPKEEAWHLFKNDAEISDDSALSGVAKQVAEECKGLPLAIVVVAGALKSNHTLDDWEQDLEQLKKYTIRDIDGVKDLVFSTIKFSYDYLKSDEAKSLLLLCSLFPEDYSIPIECLVRYGEGLELFKNRWTLKDVRYWVGKLIGHLKSSYLLLNDSEKEDSVKLHDVVRDVCLSIASEGEHEFLVSNSGVGEKNSYTAISLVSQHSNHDLLPFCKEYPRLRLLRLVLQPGELNLPEDSFIRMKALWVMELNHSQIEFPLSWPGQMLRSLRTLYLDYCVLGTGMSSMLGHMMQLETLSVFQSKILDDRFPAEIGQLSNLKLLDLRVESSLHPLPSGILSSLKKLEELYLGSHYQLRLGKDGKEERGCLKEISSISNLACLQIVLYDLNILLLSLQGFDTQRLSRFHIAVADYSKREALTNVIKNYQFRKSFELHLLDQDDEELNQVFDPNVTSIVKRTENLTLDLGRSSCLRNLVPGLCADGFIYLKKLYLYRGQHECLIDSTANLVAGSVFANLVSMTLTHLELKEICKGVLPPRCVSFGQVQEVRLEFIDALKYLWKGPVEHSSLCNLRSIQVLLCDQIMTLFSQSTLKCLVKLQNISVSGCKNLETIVLREESLTEEELELPQLKVLTLSGTNFIGFGSKDDKAVAFIDQVSLPCLEVLEIIDPGDGPEHLIGGKRPSGSLDNLKSVRLGGCDSIRCIAKADTVTLLQNLQALRTLNCHGMESLVDFEGLKVRNTPSEKTLEILPKLESLDLRGCLRLTHIWRNFPKGVRVFQNLRSLYVYKCPLNCLFHPPSVADMLISLEVLTVDKCSEMHEVIGEEDEEVSQEDNAQHHDVGKRREISLGRTSKEFVFPRLTSLQLKALENLQSFSGSHREDYEFKFPLLTELIIVSCPKLKKFCSGKLNAPLLKKVQTVPSDIENFEDRRFKGSGDLSFVNLKMT
ncbi:disease resistance protein At4g27190-like [Coffea eugenioides]|uniref:disease resistance protein At4g27190-like n=1 Tax=Coffea eugenioides TaxID=49369 RepID=UPI000F613F0E|nr:disease resistance protein At4g27190-like [Coffea eugenioides]